MSSIWSRLTAQAGLLYQQHRRLMYLRSVHLSSKAQSGMRMAQGKLGDVDAETIEARLTEITDKFNRAKQHIADQTAKLDAEQREAGDLKAKADDAVFARHCLCLTRFKLDLFL